jgi:hypothetical protein
MEVRFRRKPNRITKCRNCKRSYWLYARNVGLEGFCSAACKEAMAAKRNSAIANAKAEASAKLPSKSKAAGGAV